MKPILSVFIIIISLLVIVVLQMEERRMGYYIWKLGRDEKLIKEERRAKQTTLARLTRPQYVGRLAENNSTLKKVKSGQVIHLSSKGEGQPDKPEKGILQ